MKLFEKLPHNLFIIFTSRNKDLYTEALFILREAFKLELVIKKEDLIAGLIDSLESNILLADFSDEINVLEQNEETVEPVENISGKAYFIFRRLKETGWIETEYENQSFDENITIPDYSIKIINLLYDLASDKEKEYNSYVFATYSSLKNALESNRDYLYNALSTAYHNTVDLEDELKSLFNNIKKYHQQITEELGINDLLQEHFDKYKSHIIDSIYYPLKTMDSVPRFKNSIIEMLNMILAETNLLNMIVLQGRERHIYSTDEEGIDDVVLKVNYVVERYEHIESIINSIDKKHTAYTSASIEKMRYLLNSDRSIKGKIIEILKNVKSSPVNEKMSEELNIYKHSFADTGSLYNKIKRTVKTEGKPLIVEETSVNNIEIDSFISDLKKQYSSKKIDSYIYNCFNGREEFITNEIKIKSSDEFILLLLGTIRSYNLSVKYKVKFHDEYIINNGYQIPLANFYIDGYEKEGMG